MCKTTERSPPPSNNSVAPLFGLLRSPFQPLAPALRPTEGRRIQPTGDDFDPRKRCCVCNSDT